MHRGIFCIPIEGLGDKGFIHKLGQVKMLQHDEKKLKSEDGTGGQLPRVKPALPAKPINIPPPNHHHIVVAAGTGLGAINSGSNGSKVKQIRKNFSTAKSVDGADICGDFGSGGVSRRLFTKPSPPPGVPVPDRGVGDSGAGNAVVSSSSPSRKVATKTRLTDQQPKATPSSSPNMGCSNDCCGIILNSHNHKQTTQPSSLAHSKNGTSCSLSSATNSIKHTLNAKLFSEESKPPKGSRKQEETRIKSSSDSVDSSLSSSSGGFRDPEFIARQTMAFELYKSRDAATSSSSSNCITKPPQHIQSISQYQKSSKQLEQMLAQRLEKSLALGGPSGSTPPVHPNTTATHFRARSIDTGISGGSLSTFNAAGSSSSSTGGCFLGGSTIPKQIQQKLQEEMKLQCKNIKDKFLIEKRHPQEHYKPVYRDSTKMVHSSGSNGSIKKMVHSSGSNGSIK
ncbi:uncharacterized protein LOC129760911, partial [Uranotaenia lowii]|uniref:uncharacterized protein LOC129760911 n=1 Tax=Uranotaenia lowii TaxID=190385 RepID=UPI002479F189